LHSYAQITAPPWFGADGCFRKNPVFSTLWTIGKDMKPCFMDLTP
jgi:hypothetical protein